MTSVPSRTKIVQALRKIVRVSSGGLLSLSAKDRPLKDLSERELIQLESTIGRELFGEVPKGHRREFFNVDPTTWIWHEEWKDQSGTAQQITTRYEVQQDGILKVQSGPRYTKLEGEELVNLRKAAELYYERVMRTIYKRHPHTGDKLV